MSRLSLHLGCLLVTIVIICFLFFLIQEMDLRLYEDGILLPQWKNVWLVQFILNLLGYGSIFIPGLLIYKLVQKTDYLKNAGNGCLPFTVRLCMVGSSAESRSESQQQLEQERQDQTFLQKLVRISFCVGGLLGSYLLWGLLQERIMAVKYGAVEGESAGENFKNSLFLEFMNRILALFVAAFILVVSRHPPHGAPLYKYSFNSISNVMSSWCQYEALKYVSFPIQVLAKASKVIPVMLMGKLVSKRTFTWTEYATAGSLSFGLFLFLISNEDGTRMGGSGRALTISGIILLCGYLLFDSFTSNWQGELFRTYHMSSVQMMAGSNLFSVLFAGVSLLEQGGFVEAVRFMSRHPLFIYHIGLLALTSTSGQLFIFYTINHFGPVTFTIIMTVRQALSILLSCIYYGHPVHLLGLFGLTLFFSSIFARVYLGHAHRHGKTKPATGLREIVVAGNNSTKS